MPKCFLPIDLGLSSLWAILRWLQCLHYVLSSGRITEWIGMGLNVSGSGLVKDLSKNLPGGTEEEHENPQSEYLVSGPERSHHIKFLGTDWAFFTKFSMKIMPPDITSNSSFLVPVSRIKYGKSRHLRFGVALTSLPMWSWCEMWQLIIKEYATFIKRCPTASKLHADCLT